MVLLGHRRAQLVQASAVQCPCVPRQTGLVDEHPWQEQTVVVLLPGVPLLGHRLGLVLLVDLALIVVERLHGNHNLGLRHRMVVLAT